MAIGVQDMLVNCGDSGWSKCPVTGFDDISQSGLEIPTLTTIRQPLDELGRLAVRTLWDIFQGKDAPLTANADAALVIRTSCGCHAESPPGTEQKTAELSRYRITYHLRYLSALGQSLAAINTYWQMFNPLSFFLTNLDVSLFLLIIYDQPSLNMEMTGRLIYERSFEKELYKVENARKIDIESFIKELGSHAGTSKAWCLNHLRSGTEYLGLVIYEAPDPVHPQLYNGLLLLANTVKRLFSYLEEMNRAVQLEHEVARRTSDLVETNRKFQEEVRRRLEVEAEVLRISEMERRRFSMDLHDDICQRLAGISMYSKSLAAGKKNGSHKAALKELSALIDETLLRTRRYAHDSFPMDLGTMGLRNSLEMLCSAINKQTHCNCLYTWTAGETSPLNQAQDINVYRIIQEALQNAVKHAKANRIVVEISCDGSWFSASVQDNGMGNPLLNTGDSPLNEKSLEGLGLRSMRYRAHQAGAEYFFDSQEIGGTIVKIRIPVSGKP
jgi:signal transduction histidine kinase